MSVRSEMYFQFDHPRHERAVGAVYSNKGAIASAVAHFAVPGLAARNGVPHVGPRRLGGYARVDDAVVVADQSLAIVATDAAEGVVHIDDVAASIGHRVDGVHLHRFQQGGVLARGHGQLLTAFRQGADVVYEGRRSL